MTTDMSEQTAPDAAGDTGTEPDDESSEILLGSGQAAWLAIVTLVAFAALILAGLALILQGTSDDNDSAGGSSSSGSTSELAAEQTIILTEFAFDPETVRVPVAEEVTVTLDNEGAVEHEWTVLPLGTVIESEDEYNADEALWQVGPVAGGESTEDSFTFDESGTYQVICGIPGHFAAGMKGELEVEG